MIRPANARRRPAARPAVTLALLALLWLPLVPHTGCAAAPAARDHAPLIFGKGLLWKIKKKGLRPSYVFGTIHSGDERVKRLPPSVKSAFDRSDVFVMEVVPGPSLAERLRGAMVFSDGHHLKDLISASLYRGAVKDLEQYDIPEEVVNRLKPWAVASTLSIPETAAGTPLDKRLYLMARDQKKSIFGLETADEQVAVLNGMPVKDQVELLKGAVATFDKRFKIYEALIRDYLARDVAAIFALNAKYTAGDKRMAKDLDRRIFVTRNGRMVKRIVPRLKDGAAFVAVGAGHLPGEDGVLHLLQQRGYVISRLY